MSIVAAKVYPDGFEIAADSITVRGYTQTAGLSKHAKLFERGPLVIGGVGTAEENGLMRLFAENHQPEASDERGMLAFMAEFAAWKKRHIDSFVIGNHYLIGYNGIVFHAEGFGIDQVMSYQAIGAGLDYALAAMRCGHSPKDAVQTAIDLSVWCAAPVCVITRRGEA